MYPWFTKPCVLLLAIILVLFQTFKNPLVDDGSNYYRIFDGVSSWFDFVKLGKEPAFSVIPAILKWFDIFNRYSVFLVFALIGVGFKLRYFYKYSALPLLSILLYFSSYYLKLDNSGIRSGCAIAILLWSISDIYYRRKWWFSFKLILASFFHISIFTAIPFYFINAKRVNYKFYLFLLVFMFILDAFNLNPLFIFSSLFSAFNRLDEFTNGVESVAKFQLIFPMMIVWLLTIRYFLINYEILLRHNKYSLIIVKIVYWGLIYLYLFGPLSNTVANRLSEIYIMLTCIIYTYFFYIFRSFYMRLMISVMMIILSYYNLLSSLALNWLVDRHYY